MPKVPFTIDNKFLSEAREEALRYARKQYSHWASDNDCEDMVQEAMTTLYKRVQEGSLTELTCSLSTLVIGFLKKIAQKRQQKLAQMPAAVSFPSGQDTDDVLDPVDITMARKAISRWQTVERDEEHDQHLAAVRELVENMPEPCKTILWAYYWEDQSMREIANVMNYANARVATTQKSRCMTKLRIAMEEQLSNE